VGAIVGGRDVSEVGCAQLRVCGGITAVRDSLLGGGLPGPTCHRPEMRRPYMSSAGDEEVVYRGW
jgi:hypothetical protein